MSEINKNVKHQQQQQQNQKKIANFIQNHFANFYLKIDSVNAFVFFFFF